MPPLEACPTTPSPLRDGVIMSLRGTLAEAGGPKQSHKAFKTTRLPRALRGVYPEVLEGLAMTKTDWDTASDIHTSSPGLSPLRGVGSPSRRPRGGEEFWVVRQPACSPFIKGDQGGFCKGVGTRKPCPPEFSRGARKDFHCHHKANNIKM